MTYTRQYRETKAGRHFVVLTAFLLWVGCASNSETLEAPPATRPPVETEGASSAPASPQASTSEVTAAEEPGQEGTGAPVVRGDGRPLTVVIDPGNPEARSRQTLLEAAAAERTRRRTSGPVEIVITNENLADHATGELTVVGSGVRSGASPQNDGQGPDTAGAQTSEGAEQYWRDRVLGVRSDWRATLEEIEHLEDRVAEFRRKFYAEDDPYYRDTQIKPSWDRTLERLAEARAAAETFRVRLDEVLEEGRQAGALPGWLREGIELEPEDTEEESREGLREHEPQEPTIVEDGGLNPS